MCLCATKLKSNFEKIWDILQPYQTSMTELFYENSQWLEAGSSQKCSVTVVLQGSKHIPMGGSFFP